MIPVLLDPWLLEFTDNYEEMNARTSALRYVFSDLKARHPLEILQFFSLEDLAAFWQRFANYKGADSRAIMQWINALTIDKELDITPATITDLPCPDLSQPWLKVLAVTGSTEEPPKWRSPMILLPAVRKDKWPQDNEINFTCMESQRRRNLVCINSANTHDFFERDIDPWRLKCISDPRPADSLETKTASCKRLPRPPQIPFNLPLNRWVERLKAIQDWHCGTENSLFYIPPSIWSPTREEKTKWRNAEMFPQGIVEKKFRKTESGFIDINGYVWVWDLGEKNHWDVKTTSDVRIARVSYDGKKLPS